MTFVRFDVPQAWMPQKPADITTVDQLKSSPFWHPRGVAMLRPTLNQNLQMYFHRVQRIMPRTCHPSIIHHEAHSIIHSVSSGPGQLKLWGNAVAKALFHAGTARLEYTRTVSLLIHDVLIELNLHDWCAMRTLRIHLEDVATSTILKAWSYFVTDPTFTGLERTTDSIDATRNEMFDAATFYGDLVAIDVIPRSLFNSVISGFLDGLTSVSQCRMLYLLLVRATFHLASPIHSDYLLGWRNRLLFQRLPKLPMHDEMVQRWIIVSDRIVPFTCLAC
ncbi:hypothetical protein K503DRAFT_109367 [Rhizopogon vinicolor AM-OR11-026]|uniref:Uncharacterized protein n=1 Tax=Rhizopogon vinicolor AM-OR11-026 TaxID=1314800 RepID=A0A1B7N2P2_9AGAM|nr:hypothetical protein K503DRAFT_109367 [Rhizopogon vinicolor AM-OR11-026]